MTIAAAQVGSPEGRQRVPETAQQGIRLHLRRLLANVASRASARVFALEGVDAPGAIDRLRLQSGIELVDTPRSATVLLVAGRIPPPLHEAARRAHDAMAHPRGVLQWIGQESDDNVPFSNVSPARLVASDGDQLALLAAALHALQGSLLNGERTSSAALLPDVDPAPWRGVGPYGQGGSGMTGGVPYGRPITGRAPDRDGLELDQLPVRVGPFFAPFPAGLVLDIKLQGDVVQEVLVPGNPFAAPTADIGPPETGYDQNPFRIAAVHAIPIAELERARARKHLRWLAHALRVHGLGELGRRCLWLVEAVGGADLTHAADQVRKLRRFVERSLSLAWATSSVGRIDPSQLAGKALGPVSRAAGIVVDARADDPAYRDLGFETRVQSPGRDGSDARDRWRQRMDEIVQSLDLAARAGDRHTGGPGCLVEGPQGVLAGARDDHWRDPSARLIELLPDLAEGLEWGDMVATIVSLDLDVRAAAPFMSPLTSLAKPATSADAHSMSGMHGASPHGGGRGDAERNAPAR